MNATIERSIMFEAAHRLRLHAGACRNIHGHSYKVDVMVTGEVQPSGMVLDFKDLNGVLRDLLMDANRGWDHALLLSSRDDLLPSLTGLAEAGLRLRVLPFEPTAEHMAEHLAHAIARQMPAHVTHVFVTVWETVDSRACYGVRCDTHEPVMR